MQELIGKGEARAKGLRFYFTGTPCKRGHVSQRSVSNGHCLRCLAEKQAAWRQANPEAAKKQMADYFEARPGYRRQKSKEWRERNPEKSKERIRAWHAAHPDYAKQWSLDNAAHVLETSRKWYRNNTTRRLAVAKAWVKANPDKANAVLQRYRARLAAAPGSFTVDDIERLLEQQGYRCNGCQRDLLRRFDIDHIVPLSRGGSNWPDNLQCLCHRCNTSKGAMTMDEWLARA